MAKPCNPKGLTRVEVLVVVLGGVILLACAVPMLGRLRLYAYRVACGNNLSALGKAMLVYANDYRGELPRTGGRNSSWGQTFAWDAPDHHHAFGLAADGSAGEATISSCFYLLVKYMGVAPKQFICPGDAGTTEFRLSEVPNIRAGFKLTDAWDFGPEAGKRCSYSYHLPFGLYALTTSHDPGMAVAADRNPWLRSPAADAGNITLFKPDLPAYQGTPAQGRQGNSGSHQKNGQNVLFIDGHVSFKKRSHCGLDQDNIYLVGRIPDRSDPSGDVPLCGTCPANRRDSVLVHDTMYRMAKNPATENINSKGLKHTSVLATIDCPLPERKNAIWCATFQMAWDRLREDIIHEPIQIPAAEELATRLNQAPFPTDSLQEKSYYAVAGFEKNGIIEQVRREMKRRFPSEPTPLLDGIDKPLPDGILAYAYLSVDVGFEYPFYACSEAFPFQDSNGTRTGVTAFRAQTGMPNWNDRQVRGQVEVLYYDYGQSPETVQFAVDLSKGTQPYQVILARVPQGDTLGEAAKTLQDKIAEFKNDPDYEVPRQLRPIDTLIVPDIAYKLTHRFDELLHKHLGNEKWRGYFLFDALQMIDFTLNRTGLVLKSEAVLRPATRSASQLAQPRNLHFDRPFLICVKKREPTATPFFLMWIDNAELMQKYSDREHP